MHWYQNNCGWSFDLKVNNSARKVTPVTSKQPPYTCADSPTTLRVDLNTKVLNNNTEITSKDDKNNFNCLYAYSDKMYDYGAIFNFENDGARWPLLGQKPAALSIVATVDVMNFAQPTLNAAVASTILNHYGFTYCDHIDQNLCGTRCSAESIATPVGGGCVVHGRYNCGQLPEAKKKISKQTTIKPER
ncbi:2523_t:CDS:2 [Funneliformis mosseae]|uniref:2523_t:CDS:1 n=1 Tax=Funneliformis mosseae TaxID=27381 RepID=A0A9N9H0Q4_FUNMO|nr:2523_t:CDS:2 [Funneliformis mosseae]